jgi:hypothetical protein
MRVLVILCGHEFHERDSENIRILHTYLLSLPDVTVDYCGISNTDDFHTYENIIPFKYKVINTNRQMSKICDFITDTKDSLDYDWFMKFRPDVKLLEPPNFNILVEGAVNARAREYCGPKIIKYGMSINGEGIWKYFGCCSYHDVEIDIVLDDMVFYFHKTVVGMGAFDKISSETSVYPELQQTKVFIQRGIPMNVIGINLENTKHHSFSGDLNM